MKQILQWLVFGGSILCFQVATAGVINIEQLSGFLYSDTLGVTSLEHTDVGYSKDDFSGVGISVGFENNLNPENLGTFSWSFTNTTGSILEGAWFFAFLDADIDKSENTFFNESGSVSSVLGVGASDNLADSWEIDEPGYVFGDIYDHLLDGMLDNSNNVSSGSEDDVSLALGFSLGDLMMGDSLTGLFEISRLDIGGLIQTDFYSSDSIYFNGTVDVNSVSVSEPSSLILFLASLVLLSSAYRRADI